MRKKPFLFLIVVVVVVPTIRLLLLLLFLGNPLLLLTRLLEASPVRCSRNRHLIIAVLLFVVGLEYFYVRELVELCIQDLHAS